MYAILGEGTKENPLLDSRFPAVSKKGKGYQIKTLPEGLPNWPELRKISIWQTLIGTKLEGEEQCNSDGKTHAKARFKGLNESIDAVFSTESTDSKGTRKRMVGTADEKSEAQDDGSNGVNTEEDIDSSVEADSKSEDDGFLLRGSCSGAKDIWNDDSAAGIANDNISDAKILSCSGSSGQDEGVKDWVEGDAKVTSVLNSSTKKATGGLEGRLAQIRMDISSGMEDNEAPWDEFGRPRMATARRTRRGSPVIQESKLGA